MEVPSSIDPSLTDDDRWIATMFTQYGPTEHEQWPEGSRERYADTCVASIGEYATNLPGAIVEREVLAPPDLEDIFGLVDGSIFQGEQDIAQMAFMRPSPDARPVRDAARGPLPLRRRHPPRRRRDGRQRPQRRAADPQGSPPPSRSARAPRAGAGPQPEPPGRGPAAALP